jgi:hypothetical protein
MSKVNLEVTGGTAVLRLDNPAANNFDLEPRTFDMTLRKRF